MSAIFNRIVGLLLILASLLGLVFSIGGIYALQQIKPNLTSGLIEGVKLIGATMETTGQGLEVTQKSLKSSVDSISALQTTVETTAKTLGSTQPVFEDIKGLMEEDLPDAIRATQQSLTTAQDSAAVIDSVLITLSNVPLIGIPYNPAVSLPAALGDVAKSLEGLPDKFMAMKSNLETTGNNLEVVQADLETVAATVGQIQESVAQYDTVLSGYQVSVKQVKQQLDALIKSMPNIVNTLVLALTVFLVWMGIANLGLLTQGWELMHRGGKQEEEKVAETVEAKTEEKQAEPEK